MKKHKIILTIILTITLIICCTNKVNAATTYSWTTKQSRLYLDQQGTETTTSWETIPHTFSPSYPVSQMQYRLQYSEGLKAGNTYKFKISFLPNPDAINSSGIWFSDGTTTLTEVNCSGWARESNNYYANVCAISPESDISSNGYLYVRIVFNSTYVNTIRSYVGDFEETKGTGAIIQDSAIDIMNNQNENTQAIIDANMSCNTYDKNSIEKENKYILASSGEELTTSGNFGITSYLKIDSKTKIKILSTTNDTYTGYCFYNVNKTKISCGTLSSLTANTILTIPNGANYFRTTINTYVNQPQFQICKNGSQALQDTLDQDAEYNTDGEEMEGKQDMEDYNQAEENVLNSLDFSGAEDLDITINANTSNFIWGIVERLRQISSKIVLLFTSVLGLGIIKMVLNR